MPTRSVIRLKLFTIGLGTTANWVRIGPSYGSTQSLRAAQVLKSWRCGCVCVCVLEEYVGYVNWNDFMPLASALFPATSLPLSPPKVKLFIINMINNPSEWVHLQHVVHQVAPCGTPIPKQNWGLLFCSKNIWRLSLRWNFVRKKYPSIISIF